ncbi:MAG: alpha/beta hydrolase [Alphaproteobacteria bacterium]|nr:alpha/beta hydrolase [Alphaproteobacteria bacterium]
MPEIFINGSEGRLEGRYHASNEKNAPIALILHPHPLYGGTMNNKVVYNTFQSFVRNGFSVMRFNFRGVERSQGEFDSGVGELSDAATALDWLQTQNPDASTCWVGGFSFGAWIAMQLLMRRPEIEGFVSVSPPANMYDFSFLAPCPASGLIVMGDKDDVVQEDSVTKLVGKLSGQKNVDIDYQIVANADHYYRKHMTEFNAVLDEYINERMHNFKHNRKARPDRKRRQLPRD